MAFDPRHHVIHTADGRLSPKAPTSADDVRRIVAEALAAGAPSGIVVNFHGGLVSAAAALETAAQRLYPLYAERGHAYPLFFVWESGFLEAPFNNLAEIADESLFREFVKKAGEWTLKQMQAGPTAARRASGGDSPRQLRADLDAWFKTGRRRKLPPRLRRFRGRTVSGTVSRRPPAGALKKTVPDTVLAEQIEASIRGDAKFQAAVMEARAGLHPKRRTVRMAKGRGARVSKTSLIDKEAAARIFPPAPGRKTRLGVGEWIHVAKAIAEIVQRVLRRVRTGRDHGKYVTLVEEVLRELYVGKIGRAGWWDRMKGDTADAFKPGEEYGGTVFLEALHDALAAGTAAPRITLVGHSTGAVYIGHFLEAAAERLPDVSFDVVFEAPAATHDFLARVVALHASRIANFRLFAMSDALEENDVLVPIIYPASLLYFVSGLLEDEPDQPIAGMQRYLENPAYDAERFPNVDACRRFFDAYTRALVWAPQPTPPGSASAGEHHQDFDDRDPATLASVAFILDNGFST